MINKVLSKMPRIHLTCFTSVFFLGKKGLCLIMIGDEERNLRRDQLIPPSPPAPMIFLLKTYCDVWSRTIGSSQKVESNYLGVFSSGEGGTSAEGSNGAPTGALGSVATPGASTGFSGPSSVTFER